MKFNTQQWLKISMFNLLLVAFLGALMRYKIGFEFPYFNQKNIQHAHSHFAFLGWIAHTLFVLMTDVLQRKNPMLPTKSYSTLITLNLLCSYGLLFSFTVQGYGLISISFLTTTILVTCLFTYRFFKDSKYIVSDDTSILWFKSALWFNIISSLGTFSLAYIMATKNYDEYWYLASVYFYLHFQYNGFFIFACMGLVFSRIKEILPNFNLDKNTITLFLIAIVPTYFLSVLWAKLPMWIYIITVLGAVIQLVAWLLFVLKVKRAYNSTNEITPSLRYLFIFVAVAFTAKLLLQLGSTIPELSQLAFGFRPIVIAYLHLVLLAVISMFILTFVFSFQLLSLNKAGIAALLTFAFGVFLNELVLGVQGVAAFSYTSIPKVNLILFLVAMLMFVSLLMVNVSVLKKRPEQTL